LLGLQDGVPHFVGLQQHSAEAPLYRTPRTMEVLSLLGPQDMATYGTARSLIDWHGRHHFCGKCGGVTVAHRAGWGRRCSVCESEHFPRVDPVVIMLAEHGGRALLGRQASWPKGRYSALAGFVEPGETLEDAVLREVQEETGVRASAPRYFASQSWPFPSSLMLGFHATARVGPLELDGELEAAQWFTTREIADTGALLLPPRHTIARRLIESWYFNASGSPLVVS